MSSFRFQDLEIWKLSIDILDRLLDIADALHGKRLYRFAEQLRAAGMSAPNNIAEGSGCGTAKEFRRFLGIARRSAFENANILIILKRRKLIDERTRDDLLRDVDRLCRMITSLQATLSG